MTSVRVVVFVLLAAFLGAGGILAQEQDREKERRELREKILKKVDERLKKETERIKAEIEQILAEELGAAKRTEQKPKKPTAKEAKETDHPAAVEKPATSGKPGWFGTWVEGLSADLAEELGVESEDGAVVADIVSGGPAEKAGLAKNDLVISFGGKKISNPEELLAEVKKTEAGQKVKVVVLRKDGKKTLSVTMGDRPSSPAVAKAETKDHPQTQAKTPAKAESRDGQGSANVRERIKGFLDKMMVEPKHDEEDEAPAKGPRAEAKRPTPPVERLQERIKGFMDRMNPGRVDEDDEEGEEGSEDEMFDEGNQGFQELGEIAKRFFQEILKDGKGGDGEDGMGEGDMPDFNRLLEGAREFLEKNGGEIEERFRGMREKMEDGKNEAGERGREGVGRIREQIERFMEDMGGENGEGLQEMLKNLNLDEIQKRIREMMQGQDWEGALDGDLEEEETPAPKAVEKGRPGPKNVPAERETAAAGGGFLGVTLDEVSEELRAHHDLGERGAIVTSVVEGSPAAQAGLKQWDILLAVGDQEVTSAEQLIEVVQSRKAGDKLSLTVLRRGKERKVDVTLGARPGVRSNKMIRPLSFVSFDPFLGVPMMDPARKDEGKKKEERSAADSSKRAPARRPSPDQMRDQMKAGLEILQSFFKDRELYWQLATKDGKVVYKQKIEPEQLADMARTGGQDWFRGMISDRFGAPRGRTGNPGRPGTQGFVPGTPLVGAKKGNIRVYEAPGVRIEIREDQLKTEVSGRRGNVVVDLPRIGDKVVKIEKKVLGPVESVEDVMVFGPDGKECPASECPAIGLDGTPGIVVEGPHREVKILKGTPGVVVEGPHHEVKILRKIESGKPGAEIEIRTGKDVEIKTEKKSDKKRSRKRDRNEVI